MLQNFTSGFRLVATMRLPSAIGAYLLLLIVHMDILCSVTELSVAHLLQQEVNLVA